MAIGLIIIGIGMKFKGLDCDLPKKVNGEWYILRLLIKICDEHFSQDAVEWTANTAMWHC